MDAAAASEAIAERLAQSAFAVQRDDVAGRDVVVARRTRLHWTLSRLHVFVFLFSTPRLDVPKARDIASAALDYAVSHKAGLPLGMQAGVVSIPVLISDQVDAELSEWVVTQTERHTRNERRFSTLTFPVVIDLATETVVYQQQPRFLAGASFPQIRGIVARDIAPLFDSRLAGRPD